MTNTQMIQKTQENLMLRGQAAKDAGEPKWTSDMQNIVVGTMVSKAIAAGWAPTPKEAWDFQVACANQSAWRQKFEELGYFAKGKKSADKDIAKLLAEGEAEGYLSL